MDVTVSISSLHVKTFPWNSFFGKNSWKTNGFSNMLEAAFIYILSIWFIERFFVSFIIAKIKHTIIIYEYVQI